MGCFFLCVPESELTGLFSTAGVDRALFLNRSPSLSRAGSILATRTQNAHERTRCEKENKSQTKTDISCTAARYNAGLNRGWQLAQSYRDESYSGLDPGDSYTSLVILYNILNKFWQQDRLQKTEA